MKFFPELMSTFSALCTAIATILLYAETRKLREITDQAKKIQKKMSEISESQLLLEKRKELEWKIKSLAEIESFLYTIRSKAYELDVFLCGEKMYKDISQAILAKKINENKAYLDTLYTNLREFKNKFYALIIIFNLEDVFTKLFLLKGALYNFLSIHRNSELLARELKTGFHEKRYDYKKPEQLHWILDEIINKVKTVRESLDYPNIS